MNILVRRTSIVSLAACLASNCYAGPTLVLPPVPPASISSSTKPSVSPDKSTTVGAVIATDNRAEAPRSVKTSDVCEDALESIPVQKYCNLGTCTTNDIVFHSLATATPLVAYPKLLLQVMFGAVLDQLECDIKGAKSSSAVEPKPDIPKPKKSDSGRPSSANDEVLQTSVSEHETLNLINSVDSEVLNQWGHRRYLFASTGDH